MGRVVHFEIHAENPERAIRFYSGLLGWTFTAWGDPSFGYWLISTGPKDQPGIDGGLMQRRGAAPIEGQAVNAFVCTAAVDDVDSAVSQALAAGATLALPKMPIPGVGWLAYVKDTEGNLLGLHATDPNAK